MTKIKKYIKRKDFKSYNIPDNLGEEAEITIESSTKYTKVAGDNSEELIKLQEKNGIIQMLNQPEEDIWNDL